MSKVYNHLPPYMHTFLPTYIPSYLHTYLPTFIHTFLPTYIHSYLYTCLSTFLLTYIKCCINMGSGCGSVGRAVASNNRGPQFESSHRQTFISDIYLFTVSCIEKTKKRTRGQEWLIFKCCISCGMLY